MPYNVHACMSIEHGQICQIEVKNNNNLGLIDVGDVKFFCRKSDYKELKIILIALIKLKLMVQPFLTLSK